MNQPSKQRQLATIKLSAAIVIATIAVNNTVQAAATVNRIGFTSTTSGDWNTDGNWSKVNASGAVTGANSGAPSIASGRNPANNIYIAVDGQGAYGGAAQEVTISSAAPQIDGIYWANVVNSNATLSIVSGGSLTTTGYDNVSLSRSQPSAATLNVTGTGSLTVGANATAGNGSIILGDDSSANGGTYGTLNFSGTGVNYGDAGTISVGNNLVLGDITNGNQEATGTVNHSSGLLTVGQGLYVGRNGNGTYTLSGGSLVLTGTDSTAGHGLIVGDFSPSANNLAGANGTFVQTGGSVSADGVVSIANQTGSTGKYTISGGSFSAGKLSVAATGTVAIYGGNAAGTASLANAGSTGAFIVSGHGATSITAASLNADSSTSTLGFQIGSDAGTTLINISGIATLSSATQIDLDPLSGYVPATNSTFELLRAASITALPQLVLDGDAFDTWTLSIRSNGDGTQSLIAAVPEPASLGVLVIGGLILRRRRRRPALAI